MQREGKREKRGKQGNRRKRKEKSGKGRKREGLLEPSPSSDSCEPRFCDPLSSMIHRYLKVHDPTKVKCFFLK